MVASLSNNVDRTGDGWVFRRVRNREAEGMNPRRSVLCPFKTVRFSYMEKIGEENERPLT